MKTGFTLLFNTILVLLVISSSLMTFAWQIPSIEITEEAIIKNGFNVGGFKINFELADQIRNNQEQLSLFIQIIKDLKSEIDKGQIQINRNLNLKADIKKTSSGKIMNGVMISIFTGDSQYDFNPKGVFFTGYDKSFSKEFSDKATSDFTKNLIDLIKSVK
jgi:hypothetical protein